MTTILWTHQHKEERVDLQKMHHRSKCSKTFHARQRNCCGTLNRTGRGETGGEGTKTDDKR